MSYLMRVFDAIDKLLQNVITFFFIVMAVVFFSQIIARYFFNTGISWSEELVRYLMIWLTYLGASVMVKDGSHISMTIMEEVFPPLKKGLRLFQSLVIIVYCTIIGKVSFDVLDVAKVQTSTAMLIPMNIIYAVIPLSMVLMVIHLLLNIYKALKGVESK